MQCLVGRIERADVGGELANRDGLARTAERDVIAIADVLQLTIAKTRAGAVAGQCKRGTIADRDQTGAEGTRCDGL